MSRGLVPPQFPNAPETYNRRFMSEVVRSFSVFLQQINNPGLWRATTLVLTELQDDDSGLETGGVFNHGGFLKITQVNTPHARGSVGTSAVGSVTVTTG